MNKRRRERLSEAHSLLGRAVSIVDRAKNDEEDSLGNLPENLQASERGESMEEAIDELQSAIDSINDAMDHIDCARNK